MSARYLPSCVDFSHLPIGESDGMRTAVLMRRILTPLEQFGLVERHLPAGAHPFDCSRTAYRVTPLFSRFLTFDVPSRTLSLMM